MNDRLKMLLVIAALLLLGGGGTWLWYDTMEQRWAPTPEVSKAARENRMLAATLLLRETGHSVTLAGSIGELPIKSLPDGTLIVSDAAGVIAPEQARALLAWVRRGNTLVAQPRYINPAEDAALKAATEEEDEQRYQRAKQNGSQAGAQAPDDEDEGEGKGDGDGDGDEEGDGDDEDEAPADSQDRARDSAGSDGDKDEAEAKPAAPVADLVETDPLAAHLGVRIKIVPQKGGSNKVHLGSLTLPGANYALELGPGPPQLVSVAKAPAPLWSDEDGSALRVYREGRGHIVMMASDYFDNFDLKRYDHGQLLLALTRLQPNSKQVAIVKNLSVPKWYQALWERYKLTLVALGVTLALTLWAGMRRFGPVLPEPDRERRSLIEHIDASGAWLWRASGGRLVLLEAARNDTLAVLRRRAPALVRLPLQQQVSALAAASGQTEADVDAALFQEAPREQHQFTRQIRTLQELRNHYER